MAMNGSDLGDEMMAAVDALSEDDKKNRTKLFQAMGIAIIDHITTNSTVDMTTVFSLGVPAPMDGGAALKTAWTAAGPQPGAIA